MATYKDLYGLASESALRNRVTTAVIVAAEAIRNEDGETANHANRMLWAAAVFSSPATETKRMFWMLLAANKDLEVAQISGASDGSIQAAVNAAVNLFATG